MSIIAIFSGTYCHVEEIANSVSRQLEYTIVSNELFQETSRRYNVPIERLIRTTQGPTPFLNKLTREKERNIAYLKATLAELLRTNNIVYHGPGTHLLPDTVRHILTVCLAAEHGYRVSVAAKLHGISEREADTLIRKDDNKLFQWVEYLRGTSPWDEDLYDIVIPVNTVSVDEATTIIVENARKEAVRTTPASDRAMEDFVLAARINVVLVEKNRDVEVHCENGTAIVTINKFVKRLEHEKAELVKLVQSIPGVKDVRVKVGPKFHTPTIYPPEEFELPKKVLLVDDEKEFVHTLSDRLKTRHMESAVVYDGEEALSFIQGEEPEVIVLDLKMPGIDGIEVLRRVKQDHPATEVIILTGHGSEREERLAKELGAFAYLQKPVDIDKLSETMKAAYRKIRDQEPEKGKDPHDG